jgi:hypothetical protein
MIPLSLSGIVLALAAGSAGAQEIHRWTDAQGRVHFGDRPPEAAGAYAPSGAAPAAGGTANPEAERAQRRQKLLDAYQQERADRAEGEARQKAEEAERQRRCAQARDRLARYERGGRIYEPLPNGEHRFLSDAERDAELRTARNEEKRHCGKANR